MRYCACLAAMAADPDDIVGDKHYAAAIVLKRIEEKEEQFRLELRLETATDNPEYKNLIAAFPRIREKEWNLLIGKNRIPVFIQQYVLAVQASCEIVSKCQAAES